jgi:hypothetical protein
MAGDGTDFQTRAVIEKPIVSFGSIFPGREHRGEPGVERAIAILRTDIERMLKLLGCTSITALDRSFVDVSPSSRRATTLSIPIVQLNAHSLETFLGPGCTINIS